MTALATLAILTLLAYAIRRDHAPQQGADAFTWLDWIETAAGAAA